MTAQFPAVEVTAEFDDLLKDPRVDVIAVATPVSSHYDLALQALKAGKHVFIEKPMTATTEQAQALLDEADRRKLDHRRRSHVRLHRRGAQDARARGE